MGSETWHEPYELLSPKIRDMHRALTSLIEELEAVDWYQQRASNTDDPELKATLIHHRNEEIEHAMMNLEWIRRNHPQFDEKMRTYLFTEGPITEIEERASKSGAPERGAMGRVARAEPVSGEGSLGIGSIKLT